MINTHSHKKCESYIMKEGDKIKVVVFLGVLVVLPMLFMLPDDWSLMRRSETYVCANKLYLYTEIIYSSEWVKTCLFQPVIQLISNTKGDMINPPLIPAIWVIMFWSLSGISQLNPVSLHHIFLMFWLQTFLFLFRQFNYLVNIDCSKFIRICFKISFTNS